MNTLVGTGSLVRLVLRRERIQLPVWILVVTGMVAATGVQLRFALPDGAGTAGARGVDRQQPVDPGV